MIIGWCITSLSLAAASLIVASMGLIAMACFVPEALRKSRNRSSLD